WECVGAGERAVPRPVGEGHKKERALLQEGRPAPQPRGQFHPFCADREATKTPDVPPGTPAAKIERAVVIGAGTMGGGIAMNFANGGIPVTVVGVRQDVLDRGLGAVWENLPATVEKGRLSRAHTGARHGL